MLQKRNAFGTQWKKRRFLVYNKNQWRGACGTGTALGRMFLGETRGGHLLNGLEK